MLILMLFLPFNTAGQEILKSPGQKNSWNQNKSISRNFCFIFIIDPFADAAKGDDSDVQDGLVHIRIQQRNGRKTLTTIQGLSSDYDLKKIVRACKKVNMI